MHECGAVSANDFGSNEAERPAIVIGVCCVIPTNPRKVWELPITQAASANQKVTNNVPRENPEELPPCLADKVKQQQIKRLVYSGGGKKKKTSKYVTLHIHWSQEIAAAIR